MNMLGNHDTERVLTMLNNNVNLLKEAVVIQMTLPGVPLIYYGDEAGLTGGKILIIENHILGKGK